MSVRDDFAEIFPKHSIGVEIGVYTGQFSVTLLQRVQPRRLHLIDPYWLRYGDHFGWNIPYDNFGRLTTHEAFHRATKRLHEVDKNRAVLFHIGTSQNILPNFPDGYFDWVYLDSSHDYSETQEELELLRHKVKPEGIISGHDWQDNPIHQHAGVRRAVLEFCEAHRWRVAIRDRYLNWAIAPSNCRTYISPRTP